MSDRCILTTVETVLGPMVLAVTPRGIAATERGSDEGLLVASIARRLPGAEVVGGTSPLAAWLADWVAGARTDPPPLDLRGVSPFDAAVYAAVREVPWGSTVTYGDIAVSVGRPGAARAVGGAMSRCPLFPAVPCHRVVRAADGWSGWGGSDAAKRWLLDRERGPGTGSSPGPSGHAVENDPADEN